MNKAKSVKKIIISSALAALMAIQAIGITASAKDYYYVNGQYFESISDAERYYGPSIYWGYHNNSVVSDPNLTDYKYNSSRSCYEKVSSSDYKASTTANSVVVYLDNKNRYAYPTDALAKANSLQVSYESNALAVPNSPDAWFVSNQFGGYFYATYEEAYNACKDKTKIYKITNYGDRTSSGDSSSISSFKIYYSYSSKDSRIPTYFISELEAKNASYNGTVFSTTKYSYDRYFSKSTGGFYSTKALALQASNNDSSMVIDVSTYYNYNPYYYNYNWSDYSKYYYGIYGVYPTYYGYANYNDPSWYYYNVIKKNTNTTVTYGNAKNGDAYIYGNTKKAGWDYIESYIKNSKAGSTIKIALNKQTAIPSSVMKALDGTSKSLIVYTSKGITFKINGKNISKSNTASLYFKTGSNTITSSLVKKATKNAVSYVKMYIAGEGSLGYKGQATVKFSSKRAGYEVTFYRYDAKNNRLISVGKDVISDNGYASFNYSTGGSYLAVIK